MTEPIVALLPVVGAMVVLIVLNERGTLSTGRGSVVAATALGLATGLWVTIGYVSSRPVAERFDAVVWHEPRSVAGGFPTARSRMARDLLRDDRYVGGPLSALSEVIGSADGLQPRAAGAVLTWTLGPSQDAPSVEEDLVAQLAPDQTVRWIHIEAGGRVISSSGQPEVTN